MISALAGGGLTAAGLGGPLASGALGATAGTPVAPEGTTTPATGSGAATGTEPGAAQAGTTPTTTTTTPVPAPPGTTTQATPPPPPQEAPTVVLQRRQKTTSGSKASPRQTSTTVKPKSTKTTSGKAKSNKAAGPNGVAVSPQAVASQAALAAALASSAASVQALDFYRIPLFLLPIYKAAAVQYGVPWQILAAVNEIETNYGTDQSVSTAGAVGWMQFMPATWLQYGVDALNAGYADPYNPVDAVFAAARYLRAAGAATNLRGAILAYNHSEEYANSVLLRAKLISTYPKGVIATLTGIVDGRLPVSGKQVAWAALPAAPSSATANAAAVPATSGAVPASSGAEVPAGAAPTQSRTPGSTAPPSPSAAAAAATAATATSGAAATQAQQFDELTSAANASVVAVQDGRVVELGYSRRLGKYLVLRDVYGDLFTYAGFGSVAPSYTLAKATRSSVKSPVIEAASTHDPSPSLPASAGRQVPLTLQVKTPAGKTLAKTPRSGTAEVSSAGIGKVRLFAHPGNPDAIAAAATVAKRAPRNSAGERLALRRGAVVASGTVLGHVRVPLGASDGHLRFAIRPAGDAGTIDPGPILANWAQLELALHPQGAKATNALLGATASDVLLLSKTQLERTVLSDPGINLDACSRHEIAAGKVDKRVLAVLAFLSRSGLQPTAGIPCQTPQAGASTAVGVDITAINGVTITRHQGAGTITDLTIRTLLTLPGEFVPHEVVSLMRYPGAANTKAVPTYWNRIHLAFLPAAPALTLTPTPAAAARAARAGSPPATALATPMYVSAAQWNQLVSKIGALPVPAVAGKPSSSAIPDPKHP
jgi:Transglycosylase SLT domain